MSREHACRPGGGGRPARAAGPLALRILAAACLVALSSQSRSHPPGFGTISRILIPGPQVPPVDVEAVLGRSVQLPCDVTPPGHDKVYMVFWFRDDAGIPLYSFDVRGKALSQATHWSSPNAFGSRAYFRTVSDPASLVVDDVQRADEGVYRCRVDYRNTPTRSFRYNLTIIVPPEHPVVFDKNGKVITSSAGPYNEGDDVILNCRVQGGKPEPTVRWLVDGVAIDEQYERNTGDLIENRLNWPSVARSALGAIFTCQAANSGLAEPKETPIILEIQLKPLTVSITTKLTPLLADRRYEVTCESAGSRPPAVITWYKGKRQLRRVKEEVSENVTVSELSFTPTTEDDGKQVTCRAENPNVTGAFLEDTWKIEVVYPPIVSLRLGSTLNADDIKEGDDVYFECHVQANPTWRRLSWVHDGTLLSHNMSARVIRSNQSLVLQRVTRASGGQYTCAAVNSEGEGVSNALDFRVKFAPVCRHQKILVVGASRSEEVDIWCEVDADPPASSFRWKFNNSGETLDVAPGRFSSNGTASLLRYSPASDLDYGTLSCWAENAVGHQGAPCVYQVVAAGKPFPVRNCTLFNQTSSSVEVGCIPGFDGGLPQRFLLELFSADGLPVDGEDAPGVPQMAPNAPGVGDDSDAGAASFSTSSAAAAEHQNLYHKHHHPQPQPRQPKPDEGGGKRPLMSITSEKPAFTLSDLEPDVSFRVAVFAVNSKGRSSAVVLDEVTFRDPEKRTASDGHVSLSPLLGVVLGAALSLLSITLLVALKVRRGGGGGRGRCPAAPATPTSALTTRETSTPAPSASEEDAESKRRLLTELCGDAAVIRPVADGRDRRTCSDLRYDGRKPGVGEQSSAGWSRHSRGRRRLSTSEDDVAASSTRIQVGYPSLRPERGGAYGGVMIDESEPDVIPGCFADAYSPGRPTPLLGHACEEYDDDALSVRRAADAFGSPVDTTPGAMPSWFAPSPLSSPCSPAFAHTPPGLRVLPPSLIADSTWSRARPNRCYEKETIII